MNRKIIAKDKEHLKQLIKEEMECNGHECNLNHIDVSHITDMTHLFAHSGFNGNISQWNVSNVKTMRSMFQSSYFNGNIFNWNVEKVEDMTCMFYGSYFYGDISNWKPYDLIKTHNMFKLCAGPPPYWAEIKEAEKRNIAIDYHHLNTQLNENSNSKQKKPKI